MKHNKIPIKGWVDLDMACKAVQALPTGYPRMILVHGEPGLGKTTAVDWIHAKYSGAYMVASSTWSQKVFLAELAKRLGVACKARETTHDMLQKILDHLERMTGGLLVIDEFDRVAHKTPLVELVREIYDISDVPVALVGMGSIERTLSDIPQFPQRIGQRVQFGPLDFEDARKVAAGITDIRMTDDLVRKLWERSNGTIRLFVTELANAERQALRDGLEEIGLTDMGAL